MVAVEPEGAVNATTEAPQWQEVKFTVDSGATESVMQGETLSGVPMKEGAAKKKNVKYEVANGHLIGNLGEKDFIGE